MPKARFKKIEFRASKDIRAKLKLSQAFEMLLADFKIPKGIKNGKRKIIRKMSKV